MHAEVSSLWGPNSSDAYKQGRILPLCQCITTHLGAKRVSPPVEIWRGAVDGVREPASIPIGARAWMEGISQRKGSKFSLRVMMTSLNQTEVNLVR